MALTATQQVFELLDRSREVLVAVTPSPSTDALASALALRLLLERQGKKVEVVSPGFSPESKHAFLPGIAAVRPELPHLQKMTVEVDLKSTTLHELTHEVRDGKLRINLTPRQGIWKPEDVRAVPADYRFDLAVTIGAQDLEALGPIYESNPEFFFKIPIINIDNHPANEHFGAINAVNLAAASISEVVYDLMADRRSTFDEAVATALLAGIIGATKSFKTDNVTPRILSITGELVALGGKREEIVKHLFRTRNVATLRLWGRALARLKHDEPSGLVWSVLTASDFVHAGSKEEELPDVVEELISFCPQAQTIVLLYETKEGICGLVETRRTHDALALAKPFSATGARHAARFCIKDQGLVDAERAVISKIKEGLLSAPI
ncbi:hypothetical protein A3F28_03990 [Candidatus Uhrbacteria bacterium RIFCSPHIGHO2_12_FULL_57_11]|uniref:DDH domain-containing protein n=2 Tax=Candidatus Uhriibacteriota TaxID=1752732 RepID=A0A1F7UQ21_9BACT|nr:MAG: hypothetical protein A3D72_00880 [Candidatus Uhrbacteria bacterium RIFCSPHIGHO2_02_FULL_57_19]OGL79787.1 MAG: hypothetical protein A3F28_03990 [Candidatus Uhrbacteria bacterium RIFCSPHIGHO2_12_FULL_57_11]